MARGLKQLCLCLAALAVADAQATDGATTRPTPTPSRRCSFNRRLPPAAAHCLPPPPWQTTLAAADRLLAQRDAVTNWPAFLMGNQLIGWVAPVPVCAWTGITCSAVNDTVQLYKWGCWINDGAQDGLCAVRAQGTLEAALAGIRRAGDAARPLGCGGARRVSVPRTPLALPARFGAARRSLESLDFTNNSFTGALPGSWGNSGSFVGLQTMCAARRKWAAARTSPLACRYRHCCLPAALLQVPAVQLPRRPAAHTVGQPCGLPGAGWHVS